jgi:hypothetical protein
VIKNGLDIIPPKNGRLTHVYPKHYIKCPPQDGFGAYLLPIHNEGKIVKIKIKRLIMALYEQWVFNHLL